MSAIGVGLGLALLVSRPHVDTSGAYDEHWTVKTPIAHTLSAWAFATGLALGAAWLAFGDKDFLVGGRPVSDWSSTLSMVIGTLGLAICGSVALVFTVIVLFTPYRALTALAIDDEGLTVHYALRRHRRVDWVDVVDLEVSGNERSAHGSEVTVLYQTGKGRLLSDLPLSKMATGLSPEELEPILRARWNRCLGGNRGSSESH